MEQRELKNIDKLDLLKIIFTAQDHDVIPLLVTGTSMQPFLLNRETVVYLERDAAYRPKRGDILLYWREDGVWVLHRAIRVRRNGEVKTNGDAQNWTEVIRSSQIAAHVTHFVRKGKNISTEDRGYRFLVGVWMCLRWFHAPVAWCSHIIRRLPYKLFPKHMAKKNQKDGLDA
jgi:hypothetical protein